MRHAHWIWIGLVAAASLGSSLGCRDGQTASQDRPGKRSAFAFFEKTNLVPSGTAIDVTLETDLSSETARVGSDWSGTVATGVEGIPAGSAVTGTVTAVRPARKGDRAMIDLGLGSITVNGKRHSIEGGTEAVVAGSTRARDLGAIAGGAAAGAIVGRAVTGTAGGGVVGGVVGGVTAGKIVSDAKGYQVVLKPGMTLTFTTTESVRVRA